MVIALVTAWIVTVIGGYALRWTWTGYPGNTLWDWLQMLLVPLVFPAILLPFLLKWISGNAAKRAAMAHEAPVIASAAAAGGATS
jgi:Na+/H+-dicarboxylate symporter